MGIEDRDWFREEHAEKNGMRYNRKNATYSSAEKLFADAVRPKSKNVWALVLRFALTFTISGIIFAAFEFISASLR